jgi:hypothetical protein
MAASSTVFQEDIPGAEEEDSTVNRSGRAVHSTCKKVQLKIHSELIK